MASETAQSDTKVSVYITREDRANIDAARGGAPRSTFLRRLLQDDIARSDGRPLEVPPTGLPRPEAVERISVRISADLNARARHRVGPGGSLAGHVRTLVPAPAPAPRPMRDRDSLRQRLARLGARASSSAILHVHQRGELRGGRAMLALRGRLPEGAVRVRIGSPVDLPKLEDAIRAASDGAAVWLNFWTDGDLAALESAGLAAARRLQGRIDVDRRELRWATSDGVCQRAVSWRLRRA